MLLLLRYLAQQGLVAGDGESDSVGAVTFSPGGKFVVSESGDGTVKSRMPRGFTAGAGDLSLCRTKHEMSTNGRKSWVLYVFDLIRTLNGCQATGFANPIGP